MPHAVNTNAMESVLERMTTVALMELNGANTQRNAKNIAVMNTMDTNGVNTHTNVKHAAAKMDMTVANMRTTSALKLESAAHMEHHTANILNNAKSTAVNITNINMMFTAQLPTNARMSATAALKEPKLANAQVDSMALIPNVMTFMEKNAVKISGVLLMDMANALRITTPAVN